MKIEKFNFRISEGKQEDRKIFRNPRSIGELSHEMI